MADIPNGMRRGVQHHVCRAKSCDLRRNHGISMSLSPPAKHEDDPYHGRPEAHARAEELNDVHTAIHLEARALRHPVKSDEANQQDGNPDHNRRPFAINHPAPFGTIGPELCGLLEAAGDYTEKAGERVLVAGCPGCMRRTSIGRGWFGTDCACTRKSAEAVKLTRKDAAPAVGGAAMAVARSHGQPGCRMEI